MAIDWHSEREGDTGREGDRGEGHLHGNVPDLAVALQELLNVPGKGVGLSKLSR